jgi:hypothetical protein
MTTLMILSRKEQCGVRLGLHFKLNGTQIDFGNRSSANDLGGCHETETEDFNV